MLENRHIVVGICGGIAAFKAAGLVSQLRQRGADVHCIMTEHAAKLVTPITFGELSGNDVTVDMFANINKWDVEHIALAKLADLFVVAPATADIIGKVANGIADDMLSTTIMATKAKVLFVPSMNTNMYENPIVQENIERLKKFGYEFVEPESGHLACNTTGKGRFPKLETIFDAIEKCLYGKGLLKGKKIIISAGGTQENIDPVRYISNRSSGRMGYAIARAAAMEDADVTLVSCTTALPVPAGVNIIYVHDARELDKAMNSCFDTCDAAVMAAAVSDYRPKVQATQKIKKEAHDSLTIELTQNPDILFGLGQKKKNQFLVGFAAETNDVIEHGKEKLKRKNLDMLVANDVAMPGAGFNVPTNIASLLYKDGTMEQYPKMTKEELGHIIVEKIAEGLR
ncbi:bifunctional phosphopantothenoylcysteine decarboxylase/phosphopantothenate--cysteine ligase CoaBC [Dialister sp.]|uniref:bifunctional phosphopantothenoylcysteine decarboxylase/phosphopantothenate--cysteine ligase CoaBC n=1 Tax=Dialister sp. TaxID=1955814 RepID=UPI002E7FC570|nr:bifunctional phosphopantothenoylcysteine decarboxylase/phosphopantothenate--cysteine ligase CoaBC [Dialister sp.]MEE3452038.1 bifunctional phosphopantothenoylcysteine decarboxylase/phosphopantothenate--cysteine ligase CoaBC [Dialister sp.]